MLPFIYEQTVNFWVFHWFAQIQSLDYFGIYYKFSVNKSPPIYFLHKSMSHIQLNSGLTFIRFFAFSNHISTILFVDFSLQNVKQNIFYSILRDIIFLYFSCYFFLKKAITWIFHCTHPFFAVFLETSTSTSDEFLFILPIVNLLSA